MLSTVVLKNTYKDILHERDGQQGQDEDGALQKDGAADSGASSSEDELPPQKTKASLLCKPLPRVVQLKIENSNLKTELKFEKAKNEMLTTQSQILKEQVEALKTSAKLREELLTNARIKGKIKAVI